MQWQNILADLRALRSLVVVFLDYKLYVRLKVYRSCKKLSLVLSGAWSSPTL